MEGTAALWFGVSLFREGTLEKSGSGGVRSGPFQRTDGGGGKGREGTHPSLGPRGIRWLWLPPTLLSLPALCNPPQGSLGNWKYRS